MFTCECPCLGVYKDAYVFLSEIPGSPGLTGSCELLGTEPGPPQEQCVCFLTVPPLQSLGFLDLDFVLFDIGSFYTALTGLEFIL